MKSMKAWLKKKTCENVTCCVIYVHIIYIFLLLLYPVVFLFLFFVSNISIVDSTVHTSTTFFWCFYVSLNKSLATTTLLDISTWLAVGNCHS
ncbi:hypothetical protein JOM56_000752 [Amanita muscaria]